MNTKINKLATQLTPMCSTKLHIISVLLLLIISWTSYGTATRTSRACVKVLIPCANFLNKATSPENNCCGSESASVNNDYSCVPCDRESCCSWDLSDSLSCVCEASWNAALADASGLNDTQALEILQLCWGGFDCVHAAPPPEVLWTPTPTPVPVSSRGKTKVIIATLVLSTSIVALIAVGIGYYVIKRKKKRDVANTKNVTKDEIDNLKTAESLQYDLATLQAATNNFSNNHNKIGEGGFGPVYKSSITLIEGFSHLPILGMLPNGQEVAVKKLSKNSGQGIKEFQNEVVFLANLQHRNLVKLLGFCLARKNKLLVYEFVPNKSLDYFLFDVAKQEELSWTIRYNIIKGIAKGLQYLHEDSRLKIVHRDLKAANILLDAEMNPKIADFGMAKNFDILISQKNTSRIVGTYGYMAPEYAMHGQFSTKSDVYSFGVIVLEIVSGKRISAFYRSSETGESLISSAWRHWSDGNALDYFMDPTLRDSCIDYEVTKCINLGLLCVQDDVRKRPIMTTIIHMLHSNNNSDSSNNSSNFLMPDRPSSIHFINSDQSSSTNSNPSSSSALHDSHQMATSTTISITLPR